MYFIYFYIFELASFFVYRFEPLLFFHGFVVSMALLLVPRVLQLHACCATVFCMHGCLLALCSKGA